MIPDECVLLQTRESSPLIENLGLLSVEDLARALGKAPKTVRNMVARREIPFIRVGRGTLFRLESIEAWLVKKETKSWR